MTKTAAQNGNGAASATRSTSWDVLGDFTTTTRLLPISALAVGIGVVAAFVALALLRLIGLVTNLFYFGSGAQHWLPRLAITSESTAY